MATRKRISVLMGIVLAGLCGLTAPSSAQLELTIYWCATVQPVSVFVTPDGLGRSFEEAYLFGGAVTDGTITLRLYDGWGDLVVDYPAEDLWLATTLSGLIACPGGTIADGPTNEDGLAFWRNSPRAGGQTNPYTELTQVFVNGDPVANDPGLDVQFNSADINGDLAVNLADIVLFTQILFGQYDYAADFFWDGVINLPDASFMVQGNGAQCP